MTPTAFINALVEALKNDGGLVLLIVLIFITGVRRVWIFGRELDRADKQLTDERLARIEEVRELRNERDSWRNLAMWASNHPSMQGQPPPPPPDGD
jgi:hypothetical protein